MRAAVPGRRIRGYSSGGGLRRIGIRWASRLRVRRERGALIFDADVQDPRACGIAAWGNDKLDTSRRPTNLTLDVARLESLSECVWLEPYPASAPGAVCLTDHPDFDSVEKLELLADVLIESGISITKAVFPRSQAQGAKQEPGLDVPRYAATIRRLFEAGSEIAFHGFGPRVDAPPMDECRRRSDAMVPFSPRTWIDHGTGSYLYSRGARMPDGSPLPAFLREYGVRTYWSYADLWDNPLRDVSCWTQRNDLDALREVIGWSLRLPSEERPADPRKAVLYPFVHGANNLLGAAGLDAARGRRPSLDLFRKMRASRRDIAARRPHPFVMYGRDACGIGLTPLETDAMFDTLVINHPAVQLAAEPLEQLARTSGLLLAHVYLCAEHPYLRGGCFEPSSTSPRIAASFLSAVRDLARAKDEGKVAIVTVDELRTRYWSAASTRLEKVPSGWRIIRPRDSCELDVGAVKIEDAGTLSRSIAEGD